MHFGVLLKRGNDTTSFAQRALEWNYTQQLPRDDRTMHFAGKRSGKAFFVQPDYKGQGRYSAIQQRKF